MKQLALLIIVIFISKACAAEPDSIVLICITDAATEFNKPYVGNLITEGTQWSKFFIRYYHPLVAPKNEYAQVSCIESEQFFWKKIPRNVITKTYAFYPKYKQDGNIEQSYPWKCSVSNNELSLDKGISGLYYFNGETFQLEAINDSTNEFTFLYASLIYEQVDQIFRGRCIVQD